MLWVYPDELANPSSPDATTAIELSSQILYLLSGRKYGGLRGAVEVYACEHEQSVGPSFCVRHMDTAGLGINRLRLRGNPVVQVNDVVLNGVPLAPSDYGIVNSNILQFTSVALSSCYTITVTYAYGVEPPSAARAAARILANELLLSFEGSSACRLPGNVQSVSRQGISFVLNGMEFVQDGYTGIHEVDLWLRSVNPTKSSKRAKVFSPDRPRAYKETV